MSLDSQAASGCHLPEGFSSSASALGHPEDTPRAILEIISRYGSRLVVLAIAPVTPLAAALRLDGDLGLLQCLRRVYIQGQVELINTGTILPGVGPSVSGALEARNLPPADIVSPSDAAYNFRCDMPAAEDVCRALQRYGVPLSVLGKYAAYQIHITKSDLDALQGVNSFSSSSSLSLPSLTHIARDQMQEFKTQHPEMFLKLFPIPEAYHSSEAWFEHLPGDTVSTPYDALLVLLAEEDAACRQYPPHTANGNSTIPPSPGPSKQQAASEASAAAPAASVWFTRRSLTVGCETVGISEPPADHGVRNPTAVRAAIVERMLRAVQHANHF
jgi:hypothetical protein